MPIFILCLCLFHPHPHGLKVRSAETYHKAEAVFIIRSLDKKLVRVTLVFFTVFYISNESPYFRVHFAKRISPNGAELPVSEAVMYCDDGMPNAEINQQQ